MQLVEKWSFEGINKSVEREAVKCSVRVKSGRVDIIVDITRQNVEHDVRREYSLSVKNNYRLHVVNNYYIPSPP